MVQIYLLTEVYLILASAILLSDRYGTDFLILFNLKSLFDSDRRFKSIGFIVGLFLVLGLCLVPMDPGPMFIGDLLPEVCILLILIKLIMNKAGVKTGYFALLCAIIHMLLPSLVLL